MLQGQTNLGQSPGAQRQRDVVDQRPHQHRARGFVDARFDRVDFSDVTLRAAAHGKFHRGAGLQVHRMALGHRKIEFELRDALERSDARRRRDETADAYETETDHAVEGCADLGFVELRLDQLHLGLLNGELALRRVAFLLVNAAVVHEERETSGSELCDLSTSDGPLPGGPQFGVVDLNEEIAPPDRAPFGKRDFSDLAGRLGLHVNALVGAQRARELQRLGQRMGAKSEHLDFDSAVA